MATKDEQPDFYPPRETRFGRWLFRYVVVPMLRWFWIKTPRIDIAPDDLERLKAATGDAAVVCPNHPSLSEPVVVYWVLDQLRLDPCWIIAIDTLMVMNRWMIKAMQSICVYSVRRGTTDRPSFTTTRDLLRDDRVIVVFPEGETYGLNDTMLALHEGVVVMGFWGAQERLKQGKSGALNLVPLAVKYYYLRDMRPAIDRTLARLEAELGVGSEGTRYERLRRVGYACAARIERRHQLTPGPDASLDDRIQALYRVILERISEATQVKLQPDDTLQDKLRKLYNAIHQELDNGNGQPAPGLTDGQRDEAWRAFGEDLDYLQLFQAVRDDYVREHPSAERYLDVLNRLELMVFGQASIQGPRRAVVRVGEPIDLMARLGDYKTARREVVEEITRTLRERIFALVEELGEAAPLIEPAEG